MLFCLPCDLPPFLLSYRTRTRKCDVEWVLGTSPSPIHAALNMSERKRRQKMEVNNATMCFALFAPFFFFFFSAFSLLPLKTVLPQLFCIQTAPRHHLLSLSLSLSLLPSSRGKSIIQFDRLKRTNEPGTTCLGTEPQHGQR